MKLKVAICDDEPQAIEITRKNLETYHFETGIEFDIHSFVNPEDLLKKYPSPGSYDLLFLDMEIPMDGKMIKGYDIAKRIRSLPDFDLKIIFISNYPEYMNMGYDVQASHYLSKDTTHSRFNQVMNDVISGFDRDFSVLRVKTGRDEWILIRIRDILYVKTILGKRDLIIFHLSNESIQEHRSILSAGEELKPHGFAFANKHHLVNLRHIQQYSNDFLILDNGEKITLSRYYKKDFLKLFSKNIMAIRE